MTNCLVPNNASKYDRFQMISFVVGLLLIVAPWIHHSALSHSVGTLEATISQLQIQHKSLAQSLENDRNILKRIRFLSHKLDDENSAMLNLIKQSVGDNKALIHTKYYGELDTSINLYETAEHDEEEYLLRIDSLEHSIYHASRNSLQRTFYNATKNIRVLVTLKEDVLKDSIVRQINGQLAGDAFVIEMGSVDHYPHAIYVFLQLVDVANYYDDLTLVHRSVGGTVLHSLPRKYTSGRYIVTPRDSNYYDDETSMRQLALVEHPPEITIQGVHTSPDKFSVCFMDGGPQFYIRMGSNVTSNEIDDRETCFGKVTEGRAILEYFIRNQTRAGSMDSRNQLHMIGIQSMQVMKEQLS